MAGGHLDNLGVYELLRRRCATIYSFDGGADPKHTCSDLVRTLRFALETGLLKRYEFDSELGPANLASKHDTLKQSEGRVVKVLLVYDDETPQQVAVQWLCLAEASTLICFAALLLRSAF